MRVDIQQCHQFRYPAVLADHSSGLFVLGKIGQSLGRHFSDPQIVVARRRRQLVIKSELVNSTVNDVYSGKNGQGSKIR